MLTTSLLSALHSNFHRKPRRTRGTYFHKFRFYVWGATMAFGSVCFIAYYFSAVNRDLKKKYVDVINYELLEDLEQFRSLPGVPKSSKVLEEEKLRLETERAMFS